MDTDCLKEPSQRNFSDNNSLSFLNTFNLQSFETNQSTTNNHNFMQYSFSSSDNISSPSTPMSLMLNQKHHNSPTSPGMTSSQLRQIQAANNQLIHNSSKANSLISNRYTNESEEEDYINWENLL